MQIKDKNRDKKLQESINREAAKILVSSSDKIDKHEYLIGQEILTSNQSQMIEQAKFTFFPFGKSYKLIK